MFSNGINGLLMCLMFSGEYVTQNIIPLYSVVSVLTSENIKSCNVVIMAGMVITG